MSVCRSRHEADVCCSGQWLAVARARRSGGARIMRRHHLRWSRPARVLVGGAAILAVSGGLFPTLCRSRGTAAGPACLEMGGVGSVRV